MIPAIAARYGGPSIAVAGMVKSLESQGVRSTVATTDADGEECLPVALGVERDYKGMTTVFFHREWSEAFKYSGGLSRWLQANVSRYDVVHIHAVFSHSSIAAGRACRQRAIPYIVRPLGTLDPWSLARRRLMKRVMLSAGVRSLLHQAAAIHYTSREERRLVEFAMPGLPRGVVVPLGVSAELFSDVPSTAQADPYVLSLSRLDEKKGIEVLIDGWHQTQGNRDGAWKLVIAGGGEASYVQSLRRRALEGPASASITFAGWVGGADKVRLLRGASLFVLVSAQENFGISAAEAMACGVPVVVTPGVNIADDVLDAKAGWVVNRDAHAVAGQLRAILDDPIERIRRGNQARQWAARWQWPAVAPQLLDMYSQVLAGRQMRDVPSSAEVPAALR